MADKTYIYAGGETGIYRKEAGDDHWEELTNGMPSPRPHPPQVRAIAVHRRNTDWVYAGTQRGVYRTVDRGDLWERMDLPEGRTVWSFMGHPHNPSVM